jgi:hypothetical protein
VKVFTAIKFYECDVCQGQIVKGERYLRCFGDATLHQRCYDTNRGRNAFTVLEKPGERIKMNIHMYNLNEVTDALKHLARQEDSVTQLLKRGDFRKQFNQYVTDRRAKQSAGEISGLAERVVPVTVDGEDVYFLDDIQGVLTKAQFAEFMSFLRSHNVDISIEEDSYVPATVVNLFIQDHAAEIPAENTLESAGVEAIDGPLTLDIQLSEETATLKMA